MEGSSHRTFADDFGERFPHVRGTPRWYKSTKTPLRDHRGDVIGLAGVMYPMTTPEDQSQSFQQLTPTQYRKQFGSE